MRPKHERFLKCYSNNHPALRENFHLLRGCSHVPRGTQMLLSSSLLLAGSLTPFSREEPLLKQLSATHVLMSWVYTPGLLLVVLLNDTACEVGCCSQHHPLAQSCAPQAVLRFGFHRKDTSCCLVCVTCSGLQFVLGFGWRCC